MESQSLLELHVLCKIDEIKSKELAKAEKAKQAKTKTKSKSKSKNVAKPEKKETAPVELGPDFEEKFQRILGIGEECVTESGLRNLLSKKPEFRLYDGFEPSGRMHIAQGIFKAINVNKCTKSGGVFVFWVADWFALMNDKMGGDLEKIKTVGNYLIEVWKAAGMDMTRVEFRWASEDITKNAEQYWTNMLEVARCFNIARIKKCCQIMGRLENNLTAAQILYPLMQCTDVFFLKADICQLGVDQRKVNMLARDYCDQIGRKLKPVILSHHMLFGLKKGQEKMSKSDPDSAIFMEDTREDVERKIMKAYCPAKPEDGLAKSTMHLKEDDLKNPCLDYIQYIVMSGEGATFTVNNKEYSDFDTLKKEFCDGKIPEAELKRALIDTINKMLDPVRDHFTNDATAKELLEKVRMYKRENLKPSNTLQRLKVDLGDKPTSVVFTAIPENPLLGLAAVIDLINKVRAVPQGNQVVLFHSDLSALVLNCFAHEKKIENVKKNIRAAYNMLYQFAVLLQPTLFKDVKVLWQSECMLSDPSAYWISVINVGRHFSLQRIEDISPEDSRAGQVVASLMHVGDVLGLNATSIIASPKFAKLHQLAIDFIAEKPNYGLDAPEIVTVEPSQLKLKQSDDLDSEMYVTDKAATGAMKKITKAFCEVGNIVFNPCLEFANTFCFQNGKPLEVVRDEANGGTKKYDSLESLKNDFKSEALHPADLKTAVKKVMTNVYDDIAKATKTNKDLNKVVTSINAYIKKASKKK